VQFVIRSLIQKNYYKNIRNLTTNLRMTGIIWKMTDKKKIK
jgi:hypothetical protein